MTRRRAGRSRRVDARLARPSRPSDEATAGRRPLARDAVAGATVALVLIPQSLAYAGVAGMPAVAGLYAAALPPLAAALFVSSPYLGVGPAAMTSLLTFGVLADRAPVGSQAYLELGMLLALTVGAIRLLIGLLRAGVVAHLLSEPLLMGFLPGAALLIMATQAPALVGAPGGSTLLDDAATLVDPAGWDPWAIAFAAGALAIVVAARRLRPAVPGPLLALVGGVALSTALGSPAATVGTIPVGLPTPQVDLPYRELPSLLLPGAVIALLGFAEVATAARTFAARERQRWSANREFVGQGVANLTAGLTGAYPIGGSLSRTALNYSAGAATRRSGAISGLIVLAFLPVAAVLEPLPEAVLAAIVISAVAGFVRLRRVAALWRVSRPQFVVAASMFVLTLALSRHLELAIVAGVGISLGVHLLRELSLRLQVTAEGELLDVRPSGVLWFATTQDLHERLVDLVGEHADATRLRLALDGLGRIDLTGAIALARTLDDIRDAGLSVELVGVPPQAEGLLARYDARREQLG